MVGTTRFELATSPTPRVRSTRLSHVPTPYPQSRQIEAGYQHFKVYTRIALATAARPPAAQPLVPIP